MKVILSMAISANGMIATKEGDEDFLSHDNWTQFVQLAHKVGGFMWGRKTYEAVCTWGEEYLNDVKDVVKIIVSGSDISLQDGFQVAHSPEEALLLGKENGLEEIIVTGGATLNTEFAKRGLIDEVIFDINPAIVGDGIPVFTPASFMLQLEFVDGYEISNSVFEMKYKVVK